MGNLRFKTFIIKILIFTTLKIITYFSFKNSLLFMTVYQNLHLHFLIKFGFDQK